MFYSLETMIQHANLYRHYYGLDACDITGGEATIYKDIVPLVAHCARIGLRPTIITHGQNIREDWTLGGDGPLYRRIEEAGLDDWLISLHGGTAASHDKILCQDGSFDRLMAGLDLIQRPARFNTTLCADNYKDLPVDVLMTRSATVWNCITFNPFHYWSDKTGQTEIDFQVRYREAAPYVASAVTRLEAAGWEVNVRYWPLCIAEEFGFGANVCGYHQVPYDPWEWRLSVTNRAEMPWVESVGGWEPAERAVATKLMAPRANPVCDGCDLRGICDKPPEQYQAKYGLDELMPRTSGTIAYNPIVAAGGHPGNL